jgi:AcrR family transcriptional regulator
VREPEVAVEATVAPAAARRAGRPRSEEADRAILEAALDALVVDGYAGMSIERIAINAGVGKATIYRRWSSKAEILVEALRRRACMDVPLVDTGDLESDLLTILRAVHANMIGVEGPLMAAFAVEKLRYPELREEFERAFVGERRAHLRRLVTSAVDRGDLPSDTDVDLLADAGPALLWHGLTIRSDLGSDDLPDRIVRQLLR